MIQRLFKDYYLNDQGLLFKEGISDKKHLMGRFGGVPCIDADLWDRFKTMVRTIKFTTKRNKSFETTREIFEENKKEFDDGYGRQYYIERDNWIIKK